MAHFAELDDSNIVLRVIVVPNEVEHDGESWCHDLLGGRWKQTSYNNNIRYNYAGIGYTYDEANDVFIPSRPSEDAELDPVTFRWVEAEQPEE
jgi:hypothetical protein